MEQAVQLVIPPALEDTLVPVAQLLHYPGNARIHDLDAIEASLRDHGQYEPLIVQRSTNFVLVGNGRLEVARERLKWARMAAVFLDVDDDRARAINLVDNRVSDNATYDWDLLLEQVKKAREARQRRADEIAGQQGMFDGWGEDGFEDLVAKAGQVGAVAVEEFRGDFQPGREITEKQTRDASNASRAVGMKEVVLVLTPPQYDLMIAKINELKPIWNCKSGSDVIVELISRAPEFKQ